MTPGKQQIKIIRERREERLPLGLWVSRLQRAMAAAELQAPKALGETPQGTQGSLSTCRGTWPLCAVCLKAAALSTDTVASANTKFPAANRPGDTVPRSLLPSGSSGDSSLGTPDGLLAPTPFLLAGFLGLFVFQMFPPLLPFHGCSIAAAACSLRVGPSWLAGGPLK